jgi:hypothetical protein
MGDSKEYRIALKDSSLRLKMHPSTDFTEGEVVRIEIPADCCRALAR